MPTAWAGRSPQLHAGSIDSRQPDAPQRTPENLERLANALNSLDCKLVVDPSDGDQDVPLPAGYFTAANLARQDVWNLRTAHDNLDIPFQPGGFARGYEDRYPGAQALRVAETCVTVRIAALKDIEHSKRSVARQKDLDYLTRVGRLQAPASQTGEQDLVRRTRETSFPSPPLGTISPPPRRPSPAPDTANIRDDRAPRRNPRARGPDSSTRLGGCVSRAPVGHSQTPAGDEFRVCR